MWRMLLAVLIAGPAIAGQLDVRVTEGGLRAQVTHKVLPSYPKEAVAAKAEGVAVALVRARPDGTVIDVQSLQAPSPSLAAAMKEALLQWVIPASKSFAGMETVGKVTVYFVIQGGRGLVLDANQMPGNEGAFEPPAKRQAGRQPVPVREVSEADLVSVAKTSQIVRLDVNEREGPPRAASSKSVRIPFDEVWTRARAEVPVSATVVVDCLDGPERLCSQTADVLTRIGFDKVLVLIK